MTDPTPEAALPWAVSVLNRHRHRGLTWEAVASPAHPQIVLVWGCDPPDSEVALYPAEAVAIARAYEPAEVTGHVLSVERPVRGLEVQETEPAPQLPEEFCRRCRAMMAEMRDYHTWLSYGQGGASPADAVLLDKLHAADAELEALRAEVARLREAGERVAEGLADECCFTDGENPFCWCWSRIMHDTGKCDNAECQEKREALAGWQAARGPLGEE